MLRQLTITIEDHLIDLLQRESARLTIDEIVNDLLRREFGLPPRTDRKSYAGLYAEPIPPPGADSQPVAG